MGLDPITIMYLHIMYYATSHDHELIGHHYTFLSNCQCQCGGNLFRHEEHADICMIYIYDTLHDVGMYDKYLTEFLSFLVLPMPNTHSNGNPAQPYVALF
jgi:hypothetical protein